LVLEPEEGVRERMEEEEGRRVEGTSRLPLYRSSSSFTSALT
jgi:hypothetical protein